MRSGLLGGCEWEAGIRKGVGWMEEWIDEWMDGRF